MNQFFEGFPRGLVVKNLPANARDAEDMGFVSGLGRSSGGVSDNPLQYSCLENPMDRGALQAAVYGVAKELDVPEWLSSRSESIQMLYIYIFFFFFRSTWINVFCFFDGSNKEDLW